MDIKELRERQGWSLEQKIDHSLGVIDQFYSRLGGKVYVSFSGGKDSTIVLWLARKIYPDIKAVFCNTGNEYPDIVRFVRETKSGGANLDIIYPKLKPKEVLANYGFPLISKEVSESIYDVKTNPYSKHSQRLFGIIRANYQPRIADKYKHLLDVDYKVSAKCCTKLKKEPFKRFEKETGLSPILGNMASESRLRETQYRVQGGCNVFKEGVKGRNISRPLSIWLEQDVWNCIERYKIPIADIYRKGAMRTGCMFCGYGCQFADDNRLRLVHSMYPKMYDMFMNYTNNGVTYREALRKVLAVNGLYLPDEEPPTLFDGIDFS